MRSRHADRPGRSRLEPRALGTRSPASVVSGPARRLVVAAVPVHVRPSLPPASTNPSVAAGDASRNRRTSRSIGRRTTFIRTTTSSASIRALSATASPTTRSGGASTRTMSARSLRSARISATAFEATNSPALGGVAPAGSTSSTPAVDVLPFPPVIPWMRLVAELPAAGMAILTSASSSATCPTATSATPGRRLHLEETVEVRLAKIEVDERDVPAGARKSDGEVRDRRRLSLAFDGARDHDRLRARFEVRELDVRPQPAERLGMHLAGLRDHHEPIPPTDLARRLGDSREKRQSEHAFDLVVAANAAVERLPDERRPQAERESEHEAEQAVALGLRRDLVAGIRRLRDEAAAAGEGLESTELVLAVEQAPHQGRVLRLARPAHARDLGVQVGDGTPVASRGELALELGELARVGGGQPSRPCSDRGR